MAYAFISAELEANDRHYEPLYLAFLTSLAVPGAAADRQALYSKAEHLIRYTDDVKGLSALISQASTSRRQARIPMKFAKSGAARSAIQVGKGANCK